jgi:hypothetical protein
MVVMVVMVVIVEAVEVVDGLRHLPHAHLQILLLVIRVQLILGRFPTMLPATGHGVISLEVS